MLPSLLKMSDRLWCAGAAVEVIGGLTFGTHFIFLKHSHKKITELKSHAGLRTLQWWHTHLNSPLVILGDLGVPT